jgi:RNA polymerase sigma-B factor
VLSTVTKTAAPRGRNRARQRLVESHLPLVHAVARRFDGRGEPLDDLVQVGSVGLVKAGNRFDKSRGVSFAAFAAPLIEGEIRRHLRDRGSLLRIPRDLQRAGGELARKRSQLAAAGGGRSPSTRELAAALQVDEATVERVLRAELARESVPFSGEREGRGRDDSSDQQDSEDRLSLARSIRALGERERTIVFLRFHADMTERQIAGELGISQAHVSRLLSGALKRLRTHLAASSDEGDGGDITAASPTDSSANTVISPYSEGDLVVAGEQEAMPTGSASAAGKTGALPASQETPDVAHYLELPYTIAVQQDRQGEGSPWSATVDELPGCAAQGRTPDEAVELLRGAMESWLTAAIAQHREIPVPAGSARKQKPVSSHSGRFLVRMPGTLHAELARAAEREQLSLNRFVTNALAAAVSPSTPGSAEAPVRAPREIEPQTASARRPSRAFRIALAVNVVVVVLAAAAAAVLLALAIHKGI